MVEIRAMFKRTRLTAITKLVMVLSSNSYAIGLRRITAKKYFLLLIAMVIPLPLLVQKQLKLLPDSF